MLKHETSEHKPDSPEVIALAMRLQAEDTERAADVAAQREALDEMEVDERYLQQARVREAARKLAAETRRNNIIAAAVGFGLLVAGVALIKNIPSSPKLHETFTGASARWNLDANSETQASVTEKDGTLRITVDQFGLSQMDSSKDQYWATMRSTDGGKGTRKLSRVSLRARGEGLSRVRIRFVDGRTSWVTPSFTVGNQWQSFSASLDRLQRFRKSGDKETDRGLDRVNSSVDEIQIQIGQHVNPATSRGWIEVDDLKIE